MTEFAGSIRRRRRLVFGVVVGTTVFMSLAGAYALRTLFARPGEGALRYVPAEAVVVASIDLVPSPTQALAFKRIDDGLSRNGQDKILEKSILEVLDHSKAAEGLRPLVLRSGAMCIMPKDSPGGGESAIGFIAVSDGKQASEILRKSGYPQFYKGLKYYKTGKSSMVLMVLDDLIVLSDKPEQFLKIRAVKEGTAKSILSVPEYVAARRDVADDANVVCYISPKIASAITGKTDTEVPLPDWAAFGLAIRDGGIGLSCAGKMDLAKFPSYKAIAQMPSVRSDLFQVLPSGSYGMFALSDISGYYEMVNSSLKESKDSRKAVAEMEDSIEKGIGLSMQHDLIPGLKGNAVAALYPSQEGQAAGLDVLVVVDDSNGANPSDAVDRFQTFMDRQMAKEGNSPKLFEQKAIAGGREYRVNDKVEEDMRKSLGQGMENGPVKKDLMVGKKTIAYAVVGKAVLAASSQELLDRAVASYQSKTNGLTGDSKFASSEKALLDGSQTFATFSLSRIAEGIKNSMSTAKMSADDLKMFNSVMDIFMSLTDPMYIKGKIAADGAGSGGVFIPMDYDKLIDMIGGELNKKK